MSLAAEPSAPITQTSELPERSLVNAIRLPSGDQLGSPPDPRMSTAEPSAAAMSTRQAPSSEQAVKASFEPSGDQRAAPL
jgi:hypothetical protein